MAMSRSFAITSFIRTPPMRSSPSLISSRPATMRNAVDLPQPDGPTSTRNAPSATVRSRSVTAWTPLAYTLLMWSNSTLATLHLHVPPTAKLRIRRRPAAALPSALAPGDGVGQLGEAGARLRRDRRPRQRRHRRLDQHGDAALQLVHRTGVEQHLLDGRHRRTTEI